MIVSLNWLRSIAPTIEGTPQQLADRLGMLGAPVDELVDLGAGIGGIVIARVEEVRPHPNADRLRLCTVNAGGAPLQVVCGAPNVEAGRFYPFAPIGTTIPGGMEIRKAKLRGESSEGMLCSARELGLGRDHAGLMTLTGEWEPGASFAEQLGLNDARLVIDTTPNRPDLLSHLGVARELAPRGVSDLRLPAIPGATAIAYDTVAGEEEVSAGGVRVRIEAAEECPRYMAAVIEGVRVGPSPEWLASRLRAAGLRPINNIVDATNYVLHEVGQPLHAFDLDRLGEEVRVRRARTGESLRTLDGIDRELHEGALVIADADRPVALAGVMGGEETEVVAETSRVLLECALFDPLRVRKTARALGLSTDASHRFERGVDPEGQPTALARVIELILAVAGGEIVGPALDAHPRPSERPRLPVRPSRVAQVLGLELPREEIVALLEPIGFRARDEGAVLTVEVPPFRPDVTREIDVIEEIARRRGYDTFDSELGYFRPGVVPTDPHVPLQARVHGFFARWGFLEARTAAFAPAAESRVPLLNPLSSEESHLRDELTAGLLRRAEHNWSHGVRAIRLYEIGSVFTPNGGGIPREAIHLAAILSGPRRPPHWSEEVAPFDVWDVKGLMVELGEVLDLGVEPLDSPSAGDLLPGESFAFTNPSGERIGRGGRVARRAVDAPAWADPLWAIEVHLAPPERKGYTLYDPLPAFPAVERDLALLLPAGIPARRVEEVIRASAGDLLADVGPFDLYVGKGIPEGTTSVAWRLRFRHRERTLTDAEVDGSVERVLRALEEDLDVRRR
ncbi:MAG TPA: phenylalanine--tRNA ligase subunit beta [Longimicrobiaceae bacterium]|nr:phenylalanine--tRNA ligase subunit beta [Longimicrobiaceae bacterium]